MANTYTQMNVHAVFSVKGRGNFISDKWSEQLHRYIAGTLNETNNYSLAVNGYRDHVHIFFELSTSCSVSTVLQNVKSKSSKWINQQRLAGGKFEWQTGYSAFTYSRSQRENVINYIIDQKRHHGKRSFKDEYLELLRKNEIEYDDAYLFDFYD
ncbi:IS200/IS605 family transposase [Prolixibacteraceae bacterium JC049]|nr:IS200/IS605 family transposase [Prolixibacteraceae bacterium JC049]